MVASMIVSKLFEAAMDLIGERRKDGSFSNNSIYLTARMVAVVNQVLAELSAANVVLGGTAFVPVTSTVDTVSLDTRLLYAAAPAGIAAALMLGEDDDRYSFYRLMFENAVKATLRSEKASVKSIVDVY